MNELYKEITKCRLCKRDELTSILHLGEMKLSGVFPKPTDEIGGGPLELVYCQQCSLVQLRHSYNPTEMYGMNYGYKSSLNRSMLVHLYNKIKKLESLAKIQPNDLVLDIGSNDGSTLGFYNPSAKLVGMDPTGIKFASSYRSDIKLIADFFTAEKFEEHLGNQKAMIITSIAMMYDLEDPVAFFKDIKKVLHPQGIWHIEQSYLPLMLQQNAYDTVCHEHIEYYSLKQIEIMASMADLKIIDADINDINGGSFHVTMAHRSNTNFTGTTPAWMSAMEAKADLTNPVTYTRFNESINHTAVKLKELLSTIKAEGKKVYGYGASTKGNILLQHCKLTTDDIIAFAEVNPDKYGCVTPGTNIPIISEAEARANNPDYFIVLPWHFRNNIIEREREFLLNGGKLIFPLPQVEVVDSSVLKGV